MARKRLAYIRGNTRIRKKIRMILNVVGIVAANRDLS